MSFKSKKLEKELECVFYRFRDQSTVKSSVACLISQLPADFSSKATLEQEESENPSDLCQVDCEKNLLCDEPWNVGANNETLAKKKTLTFGKVVLDA